MFSLLFLLVMGLCVSAQSTIQFCVQVSKGDSCVKPAKEFDVSQQGGTISMLVKTDGPVATTQLRYKIYFLDNYGNEELSQTINQLTADDWTYAWQDVVFYDAGTYKVKVYRVNTDESFLCSGILKIFKPGN